MKEWWSEIRIANYSCVDYFPHTGIFHRRINEEILVFAMLLGVKYDHWWYIAYHSLPIYPSTLIIALGLFTHPTVSQPMHSWINHHLYRRRSISSYLRVSVETTWRKFAGITFRGGSPFQCLSRWVGCFMDKTIFGCYNVVTITDKQYLPMPCAWIWDRCYLLSRICTFVALSIFSNISFPAAAVP